MKSRSRKLNRRSIILGLSAAPLLPLGVKADEFPSRPIRMIVPFGPGSTADIIARKVGAKAGDILKQSVVIENRPGSGGTIGAAAVATSAPDGYTLCLGTVASHSIAVTLQKPRYDTLQSFRSITLLVTTASLIVVNTKRSGSNASRVFGLCETERYVTLCVRRCSDNYPTVARAHQGPDERSTAAYSRGTGR